MTDPSVAPHAPRTPRPGVPGPSPGSSHPYRTPRRPWLAFVLAGWLLSLGPAVAGELAQLHAELATPVDPACSGKTTAPPGLMAVPGSAPCPEAAPAEPTLTAIGLERSDCFGGCPAYTVIVRADGGFRYEGVANVDRLGPHSGRVDPAALRRLLRFAEAIEPFALADSYLSPFLDEASSYLLVERPGARKVILAVGEAGPPELWALGRLIDDLLANADWDE